MCVINYIIWNDIRCEYVYRAAEAKRKRIHAGNVRDIAIIFAGLLEPVKTYVGGCVSFTPSSMYARSRYAGCRARDWGSDVGQGGEDGGHVQPTELDGRGERARVYTSRRYSHGKCHPWRQTPAFCLSDGPMSTSQPSPKVPAAPEGPKARGANRSTKVAGKLKVLPDQPEPIIPQDRLEPPARAPPKRDETEGSATNGDSDEDEGDDEIDTEDVEVRMLFISLEALNTNCSWVGLQPHRPHSCRHCATRRASSYEEKGKVAPSYNSIRDCLVRSALVSAHRPGRLTSTYSSYRFSELMRFFNARRSTYHTNPRIIDDVIYTPYAYDPSGARHVHFSSSQAASGSDTAQSPPLSREGDLLGVPELAPGEPSTLNENGGHVTASGDAAAGKRKKKSKFEEVPTEAEIFIFQYGTVVIWGMTEAEEKRFLSSM